MKKRVVLFLAALLGVIMLCAPGATAETENGFTYTVSDGCATITNYSGSSSVVIPDTLGGYPVTAIGDFSFSYSSITSVTMPDSIVSIGNYAFYNRTSLSSVTLSSGVVSIGDNAFASCSALTEITLPDSVTTLGSNAFYKCTNLSSVTLSSGLTAIGSQTFYNCTALTSISIPEGVASIGSYAFRDCSALTEVHTPSLGAWVSISFEDYSANPLYYAKNLYVSGSLLTNAVIPDSIESINKFALNYCTSLTSVSIPASVTHIAVDAFYGCSALEAVYTPSLDAWLNIQFDYRTANPLYYAPSFYVSGALLTEAVIPEGTTAVGDYAFYGCDTLAYLSIPESVTAIGQYAFYDCASLTSISLHDNIETIGDSAFTYAPALLYAAIGTKTAQAISASGSSFTVPGYTSLSLKYDETTGLTVTGFARDKTAVTIPEGVEAISSSAFKNSAIVSITLPSTLKSIPDSAFYGCASLTSIAFPDSLTTIGKQAFYNCTKLASVTLGSGLTSIGDSAFYNCTKLKKVYVPTIEAWMNIQFVGYYSTPMNNADNLYVGGSVLKTLVIPEGTTAISDYLFKNCKSLASVTLPASLTSIGEYAFSGCESVKEVHIPTLEAWLNVGLEGYNSSPLQGSNAENCTLYIGGSALTHLVIPEGTTAIDAYRFHSCRSLVSVDFPDTLESVGYAAFEGCWNLKSVTLPESVHTVDAYAFNCGSSLEIDLPDNITTLGAYQPFGDSLILVNTDSVTFATLSDLGSEFRYCDKNGGEWVYQVKDDGSLYASGYRGKATDLTFPDNVTGIAGNFDDYMPNRNLVTTIRIPDNVRIIEWNVFIDCNYLTELYLPDNIEEIDTWPFDIYTDDGKDLIIYCTKGSLTAINLSAAHDDYVFCDLSDPDWLWRHDDAGALMLGGYRGSATSITLPAGVTAIADSAFDHERNDNIVSITIPEGYESIGYHSLSADNLAHVSLPSTLRSIGNYAFSGCEFSMIQLPEGLETIGEYAFSSCYRMTSLTIPSTVTSISSVIARYCDNLTTVVLPAEIEYIAPNAFGDALSTVYCYRDTYAQEWAKENSPLVRLIGEGTLEDLVTLGWLNGYADDKDYKITEVGRTAPFMGGVTVGTMPLGASYTFTCVSSDPSVARVDGEILTFLKPGKVTITVAIAERPDVTPIQRTIEVYNPVTSFTVPEALFVHIDADDPAYLIPENIEPAEDANPYFRRRDVGQGWWEWCNVKEKPAYFDKGVYFLPEERLGAIKCEIESFSGIVQPILFVTYDVIGEVYANAPARPLVVGQIWEPDVTVMVDGAELSKLSYLYTLKTSNKKVATITEDEMIKAVAPGTATITVTARNSGKTAKFTVTVTEPVTLNLPAALTAVSEEAFIGVSASEVVIPEGCTSIGARAFADCANLESVTIPASVTDIAEDAFSGCSGVTVTTPAGSAAAQMFGGMEGFTVVTE